MFQYPSVKAILTNLDKRVRWYKNNSFSFHARGNLSTRFSEKLRYNRLNNLDVFLSFLPQGDQEAEQWADVSPYAFQMWQQPLGDSNWLVMSLMTRINKTSVWKEGIRRSLLNVLPIQPSPNYACAAAVSDAGGTIKWVKFPCDHSVKGAGYICEIKANTTDESKYMKRNKGKRITADIQQCPPRTITLMQTCVGIYTSIVTPNNISATCVTRGDQLYKIPKFYDASNPFTWTSNEHHVSSVMQAMNHRLPRFPDYATMVKDQIITARDDDTIPVALQFSHTALSQVAIVGMDISLKSGSTHVACEFPLLLANGACLTGQFACLDGTCILKHYVCDGVNDCPDISDETDCDNACSFSDTSRGENENCFVTCFPDNCICNGLYYQCRLGGCVPWCRVCDGIGDCSSEEDEQLCEFFFMDDTNKQTVVQKGDGLLIGGGEDVKEQTIKCHENKTISVTLVNDLVPDCPKYFDEQRFYDFLTNGTKNTYSTKMSLCNNSDETCVKNYPDVCYPRHLHCVYESRSSIAVGCRNAGHLLNCQHHVCPSQFKCTDAYCIPVHNLCDGKQDCPDGEDEVQCHGISCPGLLLCRHDKICVHVYDIRQGHAFCPKSEDDQALRHAQCPSHCSCVGHAMLCKSSKLNSIPKLSIYLRVLFMKDIPLNMGHIKFHEGSFVFLLQLTITNASLESFAPMHIARLTFLQNLNLSYNNILSLKPGTFSTLKNLLSIDMSYNLLSTLYPDMFEGPQMVKDLRLDNNNIRLISACAFRSMSRLQVLKLSHNRIAHLGDNILCSSNFESCRY